MRFYVGKQSGLSIPDRNPLLVMITTQNTVFSGAAGGGVVYTCPAARRFQLAHLQTGVKRNGAAGAVGQMIAGVTRGAVSGLWVGGFLVVARITTNTIGDHAEFAIASGALLAAGQTLFAFGEDASTGGSGEWFVLGMGTEFDA